MFVFLPGWLWDAGQLLEGIRSPWGQHPSEDAFNRTLPLPPDASTLTITVFGPGEAHAAEVSQPALVRKKLPALVPAAPPSAEPLPAPMEPAIKPAMKEQEKPKEAAAPEPTPTVAAPLPEPTPPPPAAMPEPAAVPPPSPPPVALPAKMDAPKPQPQAAEALPAAYPFSLLLSSCKEKENAVRALSGYRQVGLTPYIVHTDLGSKGVWWRTLTGHYRTLAEATQAKRTLNLSKAVVVKTPYANLIGRYGSETEAAEAAARVARKGVFPYLVKGPGPSFQLMAGAYSSQNDADSHRRELDARGVSTRTVQR
jgi:hypothetical protein